LYCAADAMRCVNGTIRAPHPVELFGDDWLAYSIDTPEPLPVDPPSTPRALPQDGLLAFTTRS